MTMRLSCTVMEIWRLKDTGCTDVDTERKAEEEKEKKEGGGKEKGKG